MPYKNKEDQRFAEQKHTAKKRGISFEFTLDDWKAWWEENAGPNWLSLRGCRAGQLVMARYGDLGPYARGNVKCITISENLSERKSDESAAQALRGSINIGETNGSAKLTADEVLEARELYARGASIYSIRALAKKYGVSNGPMGWAIRGKSWSHI